MRIGPWTWTNVTFATPLLVAGLGLLLWPRLWTSAIGVELVALAFALWSRSSDERSEQVPRWAWLRRPAMALWLAAALAVALPQGPSVSLPDADAPPSLAPPSPAAQRDPLAAARVLASFAVLWAGLELGAALPLSRPFPDLSGPLAARGPWLPVLLPAMGFALLLRHAPMWTAAPFVREIASVLLAFAAMMAVLRAYTRRSWTASLRWLGVFDSALAMLLVASRVVANEVVLLLWIGAFGGRAIALAGELRGAVARRGPLLARAWRLAGWISGAALSWPLLAGLGFAGGRFHPFEFCALAIPVALAGALSVRRVVEAPERRTLPRPDPLRWASAVGAGVTLIAGPIALAIAWWSGFEASFPGVLIALLPGLLGAWPRSRTFPGAPQANAARVFSRELAVSTFRFVTAAERAIAGAGSALGRALGAPARDLHTGDAQEYLLFLVGASVLALVLPLFR